MKVYELIEILNDIEDKNFDVLIQVGEPFVCDDIAKVKDDGEDIILTGSSYYKGE